jgi:DNA-directed RNA polymerase specialized sigma24 family protein
MVDGDIYSTRDLERFWRIARAEAGRRLYDPRLAEDLAEDAYFQLMVRLAVGRVPENPEAWLVGVVRKLRNKILAQPRANEITLGDLDTEETADKRRPATPTSEFTPRWVTWRELLQTMEPRILFHLAPRQREVYRHLLHEQSIHAVARACGSTPKDIRDTLQAIARRIRTLLLDPPSPGTRR